LAREEIENDDVKLGRIPNNLTLDELRTIGVIVPENPEEKRKHASRITNTQNLFFYYHARPDIFKNFENCLNLAAIKANQPVKKMRTFFGTH
jgi:hypothetical protein